MSISITKEYLQLKQDELQLAFEYQRKKQQEKRRIKSRKGKNKENKQKLKKELEKRLHNIEKEQTHYQTAYEKLKTQIAQNPNNADLLQKQKKLESTLSDIEKIIKKILITDKLI